MTAARKSLLIWIGGALLLQALVMAVIAACTFTAHDPLPLFLDTVARLCFWGFFPAGIVGTLVLSLGLMWKRS